jgi:hypothetical protein
VNDDHPRGGMEKEVETLMLDLWTSFAKNGYESHKFRKKKNSY